MNIEKNRIEITNHNDCLCMSVETYFRNHIKWSVWFTLFANSPHNNFCRIEEMQWRWGT